ncbi:hypothetical protein ACLOJK_007842 [Asimina triloba]
MRSFIFPIFVRQPNPSPWSFSSQSQIHLPNVSSATDSGRQRRPRADTRPPPSAISSIQQGRLDLGHSTQVMASTRNENPFKTHLKHPSTEQPQAVFMQQWADFQWVNSRQLGRTWLAKLEQSIRPITVSSPWQPTPIEQGRQRPVGMAAPKPASLMTGSPKLHLQPRIRRAGSSTNPANQGHQDGETQLDGRNQPPQIAHANPSTSSAGQHRSQQGSSDCRDRDRAGVPNSVQRNSSPVASAHPVDPDPSTNVVRDPRKAAKQFQTDDGR